MTDGDLPASAYELARRLGDRLPDAAKLPDDLFALAAAVRRLTAAAVATDLPVAQRNELAAEVTRLAERLEADRRDPVIALARWPDGRIENLTQAGSGRLNPHAPGLVFDPISLPDTTAGPVSVEVVGRCVLSDAHAGPPARAHGGVVATLLDETLGLAATVAGATGLTAGINLSYRAATPLGAALRVQARYTRTDGRKRLATGEVVVEATGQVTAVAEGIFVSPTP